jgi:hypothetical protein
MNIRGIGAHDNTNNPADADVMFQGFVEMLKEAGHSINHASFSSGYVPEEIGTPFGGGFFAGEITLADERYALIVAPKAEGEKMELEYKLEDRGTSDGTDSDDDGFANSDRINDANHPAVQFCRGLRIGGFDDWYLPSRDELAMLCRNLGPTRKTTPELFKTGNAEAFIEDDWYWSSTEYAPDSYGAWMVDFDSGTQNYYNKNYYSGVRAVRRLKI